MGVTAAVWSCANFVLRRSFWIRCLLEFNINESGTKDIAVGALVCFKESIWICTIGQFYGIRDSFSWLAQCENFHIRPYKACICPYLDLSPNKEIYRPNTDIYSLYKDQYTSVFALYDKRKYKPWSEKCRYARLSFLWAGTRFTNADSFRMILTIPSMTFIDRCRTIWSITNSFLAFNIVIIGIWVI